MEAAFSDIYKNGTWVNPDVPGCPRSGLGSLPDNMKDLRAWLHARMCDKQYTRLLDLGCGDHCGLRDLCLEPDWQYLGIDCVADVINENKRLYTEQRTFQHADVASKDFEVPPADLVLLKDCLQHMPNRAVLGVLWQMLTALTRGAVQEVILVNDAHQPGQWADINPGGFRPLEASMMPLALFPTERVGTFAGKEAIRLLGMPPARPRVTLSAELPLVTIAILAKDKAAVLPLFLENIGALQYPTSRISLYVRTNNNTDNTAELLCTWLRGIQGRYAAIHYDDTDSDVPVHKYGEHEWNGERFKVLGAIRQHSMQWAMEQGSQYYYVQDVDNFVVPETLLALTSLQLPIVAPLLRKCESPGHGYANFHAAIDEHGYLADTPLYWDYWGRRCRGIIEQPVVHCTYLVHRDAIPLLSYDDGSGRYEYVIFSDSARKNGVPQYLDTRRHWGWLTMFGKATAEQEEFNPNWARALLALA